MPIDSDNEGKRVILSDGSPSERLGDAAELWPAVKIRGVVWSGRGVSSAEGSSWGRSYSKNGRVDECWGVSPRGVCLDGKKRDNGGSRDGLRGGDLSE